MTLVHPPHILANLYFFEPLGCPEYEIGLKHSKYRGNIAVLAIFVYVPLYGPYFRLLTYRDIVHL